MTMEIRLAASEDAADIAEIYRPIVVSTPISFETEPPDAEEIRRRIHATLPKLPWLVCVHQGRVTGYAYSSPHKARAAYQWSVDASVYVHSEFRRCGTGAGLYTSLFEILAAQGYFNAFAGIALPNPGSVGIHEAMGFHQIGVYHNVGFKLGRWHDVGWWQRPLRPSGEVPGPTLKIDELQRKPSWPSMLAKGLANVRTRELE
jgi:phosphinothricin acetyltransferase